jgi:diphthamide biosynthesis protein 2
MASTDSDDAAADFLDDFNASSDDELQLPVVSKSPQPAYGANIEPDAARIPAAAPATAGAVAEAAQPNALPAVPGRGPGLVFSDSDLETKIPEYANSTERCVAVYELESVVQSIHEGGWRRVALQLPDHLLGDALDITEWLQAHTSALVFVLGDTSYGSCCVDEVAAEHYTADLLVHFGAACMAPVKKLPVRYVFGQRAFDLPAFFRAFTDVFGPEEAVTIICEQALMHHLLDLRRVWGKFFPNVVFADVRAPGLVYPQSEASSDPTSTVELEPQPELASHIAFARSNIWSMPSGSLAGVDQRHRLLYVGNRSSFIVCTMILKHTDADVYSYTPLEKPDGRADSDSSAESSSPAMSGADQHHTHAGLQGTRGSADTAAATIIEETAFVNHAVQARYLCIERAKEAEVFGIVVSTLSIAGHVELVERLKAIVRRAGKKAYVLVVGKINVPKLANFAEIDMFVVVACELNSLFDNKCFYHPLITPFELEMALVEGKVWNGGYDLDFRELLSPDQDWVTKWANEAPTDDESAIVVAADRELSTFVSPGAERLNQRSWVGLDPEAIATASTSIVEGRNGRAWGYSHPNTDVQR